MAHMRRNMSAQPCWRYKVLINCAFIATINKCEYGNSLFAVDVLQMLSITCFALWMFLLLSCPVIFWGRRHTGCVLNVAMTRLVFTSRQTGATAVFFVLELLISDYAFRVALVWLHPNRVAHDDQRCTYVATTSTAGSIWPVSNDVIPFLFGLGHPDYVRSASLVSSTGIRLPGGRPGLDARQVQRYALCRRSQVVCRAHSSSRVGPEWFFPSG